MRELYWVTTRLPIGLPARGMKSTSGYTYAKIIDSRMLELSGSRNENPHVVNVFQKHHALGKLWGSGVGFDLRILLKIILNVCWRRR